MNWLLVWIISITSQFFITVIVVAQKTEELYTQHKKNPIADKVNLNKSKKDLGHVCTV